MTQSIHVYCHFGFDLAVKVFEIVDLFIVILTVSVMNKQENFFNSGIYLQAKAMVAKHYKCYKFKRKSMPITKDLNQNN